MTVVLTPALVVFAILSDYDDNYGGENILRSVLLFTYSIVVSTILPACTMVDLTCENCRYGRLHLRPSSKAVKFKLVLSHDRPCSRFTRCWIPTSIPPVMYMNGDSMHLGGYAPVDLIKRTPAGQELIQWYDRSFVIHEGRSSQRAGLSFTGARKNDVRCE